MGQAAEAGLDVIAITDHDTTQGWPEAMSHATALGVGLIPGIELSAQILHPAPDQPPLSVHVLGYLIDPDNQELAGELLKIRAHRDQRLQLMVERLAHDLPISWEEVAEGIMPGATPGRPHIAEVLVGRGIVDSVSEAFDHYLAADGPYHVPHYAPRLARALELIRNAGGVPVLAHPLSGGRRHALDATDSRDLARQLSTLADQGLLGVEVHHRENDPDLIPALEEGVRKLGLIVTGSSDFHGSKKPNRLGEFLTDRDQLEKILDQGSGVTPVWGR